MTAYAFLGNRVVDGVAELRHCRVCQDVKELSEFHRSSTREDGYDVICRTCVNERTRRNRATRGESRNAMRIARGLRPEQLEARKEISKPRGTCVCGCRVGRHAGGRGRCSCRKCPGFFQRGA